MARAEFDSVQRLWRFDWSGKDTRLVLPNVNPVGYFAWASDTVVGLFVLGTPPTLLLASTISGETKLVWRDIGRSIQKIPHRSALSFVGRCDDGKLRILEIDSQTQEVRPLIQVPEGSEYHAWTPQSQLLIAHRKPAQY